MNLTDRIRKFPYVLAPLAGYTDYPFRLLAREYGASLVFTEMVNVHSMAGNRNKIKYMLYFAPEEKPVGLQLFGNNPQKFHDSARIAAEMGFDLIDINFGCPVHKVIRAYAGAYLHKDLKAVESTIAATVKGAGKLPVSIKMRSGWSEDTKNFLDIAKIAEDNGVTIITLHPRTRTQMFTGSANWEHIKELKQASKLFIIGNGDVKDAESAVRLKKETGCDAVMIGRAAIGNPFIFKQIKDGSYEPSFTERVETCKRHLMMLHELKAKRGIMEMRKYYAKYLKGHAGIKDTRQELISMEKTGDIIKLLDGLVSK